MEYVINFIVALVAVLITLSVCHRQIHDLADDLAVARKVGVEQEIRIVELEQMNEELDLDLTCSRSNVVALSTQLRAARNLVEDAANGLRELRQENTDLVKTCHDRQRDIERLERELVTKTAGSAT